jgi:hypothetical protein
MWLDDNYQFININMYIVVKFIFVLSYVYKLRYYVTVVLESALILGLGLIKTG